MGGERRKFLLERLGVVLHLNPSLATACGRSSCSRQSWILDAADILRGRGANLERMVFEDQSRNTFENVRYSKNVLKPKPGECWLLITSAYHMARTVGAFQKVGCDVMPYTVDYRITGTQALPGRLDVARRMQEFDLAVRSWLGLLAYDLMDLSRAFCPRRTWPHALVRLRSTGTSRKFAGGETVRPSP
jgi:uncharacterized SAM-binding protein YcdF (DUF218 family)